MSTTYAQKSSLKSLISLVIIIDAKKPITEQSLVESGLVRRIKDGVRILAKGDLTSKLDITVTGASASAIEAVAKAGGALNVTKAAKVTE